MPGTGECESPFPDDDKNLYCIRPLNHEAETHITCLGFHPEPYNVYEWAEWKDDSEEIKVWTG